MKLVKYNKKNAFTSKFPPSYPNEMMVKIFNSNFYTNIKFPAFKKNKILEIGCFSGNNLRFFIENGFDAHGVEINQKLIDLGKKNLKRLKIKIPDIKLGNNLLLPFDNQKFDTLVSINTIHYSSGQEIHKALSEYKRVLKPGGILYLETVGDKHFAKMNAKKISTLSYKSNLKDFRKNHIFGYFDSKDHLKKIMKRYFKEVELFERFEIMKNNLHFYVVVCR